RIAQRADVGVLDRDGERDNLRGIRRGTGHQGHLRRADGIEVRARPIEPVGSLVNEVLLVEAADEGADAPVGRCAQAYLVALVRVPLMVGPKGTRGVTEPGRPGGRPPYGIAVRVGPVRKERVARIVALVV